MTAIVVVLLVLQILAHTDTILRGDGAVLRGVDPNVVLQTGKTPLEFVLTTAPWYDRQADRDDGCDFQILARVKGGGPTRLVLDGTEMPLDDNWNPRSRIDGGTSENFAAWFIDPISRETLAYRETTFHCRARAGGPAYVTPDMSGVR